MARLYIREMIEQGQLDILKDVMSGCMQGKEWRGLTVVFKHSIRAIADSLQTASFLRSPEAAQHESMAEKLAPHVMGVSTIPRKEEGGERGREGKGRRGKVSFNSTKKARKGEQREGWTYAF